MTDYMTKKFDEGKKKYEKTLEIASIINGTHKAEHEIAGRLKALEEMGYITIHMDNDD